jgi:uncharacterized delta-60 repeat protein
MKAKLTFVSLFAVVTLLAIPAHSQDFLKRLKPWLYPDDSLDALGAKRMQPPEFLFGSKNFGDKRTSLFSNFSPPLNEAQNFFGNMQEAFWVSHYASGLGLAEDVATALAVDAAGNVYVTGYSRGLDRGLDTYDDYATVKYNASGIAQWVARYNGPGNENDRATALAVDAAGNVYVTGYSQGSDSVDYATVKYDASGVAQWVARYNGRGNSDDRATALAVDAAGNVYVTGSSQRDRFLAEYEYATVKYNASGVQQWVYNGEGNHATALAVDAAGNVYVTGYGSSSTLDDFVTVKFNAIGGAGWVARYNGPGNEYDQATALAIDAAGNVYVTGYSAVSGTYNDWDYATVKYNATGGEQWVARYNGPGNSTDGATALAVDAAGNVYVTGSSQGSGDGDYATVKYSATGVEQWVARYNGPENNYDGATALAVDATGNVYVTGSSQGSGGRDYATVKYNATGIEQWMTRLSGPGNSNNQATALVVDAAGNVYVTGSIRGLGTFYNNYNYATAKYNASGTEQWVARYNGPGKSFDYATALAVDAAGNVYVTGSSRGLNASDDYATVKYNASGVEQWVARYNGRGNYFDRATALAVDAVGNVYVTGYSVDSATSDEDFATVKYNAAGFEQWVVRYNGPSNSHDQAVALAVDAAGNVYVTGYSLGSSTSNDYATIKYSAFGVEEWVARYNNSDDRPTALAVDAAGNVYVTGYSTGAVTSNDYATVKYNATGVEQWVVRYNRSGNSDDQATALAVDVVGNVYVTGLSYGGSGTSYDYATIKYDAFGVEQWVARYNGLGNHNDEAAALAVDVAGNVYVTGYSLLGSGGEGDYATVKYNASGIEQWVARYTGPGNAFDRATALAVDTTGNVYVTGSIRDSGRDDYATIKYNASGVEQWVARYNGTGNSDDRAIALVVDAAGNVYVTGSSQGTDWSVYTTIKYFQKTAPIVITNAATNVGRTSATLNGMVNPNNLSMTVKFQYGTTANYGSTVAATPSTVTGAGEVLVSAKLSNLSLNTTYHYRLVANNDTWSMNGMDQTFTTRNNSPTIVNPIPDINLTIGSGSFVRDLSISPFVFTDADGDALVYSAISSSTNIATAAMVGSILTVSPVATGNAKVTVTANDNKGGETPLTFNVTVKTPNTPPSITPIPIPEPQPENQPIVIHFNITDNSGVREANFYYRKGGEADYRTANLQVIGPTTYRGTISKNEVTSLGLEYYVEAIDVEGLPARNPEASGFYSIQVSVAAPGLVKGEAQPGGSEQNTYRLVSAPLDLDNKDPQAVFLNELGLYNKKKWRLYAFDTTTQKPVEFPGFTEIKSGQAYWLIVKEPGKRISTGTGKSNQTDKIFLTPLHSSWNFVANPYNFAIPLGNVKLKMGISVCAIDSLKIRTYLGHWNDTKIELEKITELKPFEGYAVFNDSSTGAFLIDPDLSNASSSLPKAAAENGQTFWAIRILAHCQEASDVDNIAAVATNASLYCDELDQPEPPVIGEYVSVYFPHPEWAAPVGDKLAKIYCTDVRPESSEGYVWEFEVKTNIRDKVNLTFEGLDDVPSELEVWLVDDALKITQNLREQWQYAVAGAGADHPKQLKLVVGKRDFIDEKLIGVQAIPTTYELSQNFPNPFNPATTIRYGLPSAERVTLKIYNLLGAEVATLVDNEQKPAGYHAAVWDGRDGARGRVASGIYLIRMRAGNFVRTRKMLLIE